MPKKPNTPQEDQQVLTDQEAKATEERKKVVEVLSNEDEKTIQEIVDQIESEKFDISMLNNIDPKFHPHIADQLIEEGRCGYVAEYLKKFKGLDKEIAFKLIEAGESWEVASNLNNFKDLDHNEVALKLIENERPHAIAEHLYNFKELNKEIALKLIDALHGDAVAMYFDSFKCPDHKEIVMKIIKSNYGWDVGENLSNFEELDKEVAIELINIGKGKEVAEHYSSFEGFDDEIAMSCFLDCIDKGHEFEALMLGNEFKFLKNNKKYIQAFIPCCEKLYPNFQNYLKKPTEKMTQEFKNELQAKEKHITPELILKFESIVRFAENHVSQTLKNKVKEYGYDPDTPDYKTKLTDDQKLELRQLMQDKQEDIRAKIQHIASPELIRAYQNEQEEGEADFLTIKAA